MTIDTLRRIYDQYQRKTDNDVLSEIITLEHLTRFLWHDSKAGMVGYSALDSKTADATIQAELDYFRELGYSLEWKHFSYDTPPDLPQRLLAHGFSEDEHEAVMVLPVASAPQKLLAEPTFDIQKATTLDQFHDMDAVFYEVWQDDPHVDATPTRMSDWLWPRYQKNPDGLAVYVVYVDGKAVSYGRVEYTEGNPFASIWGGSTLEAYRRRGIYTQLVAKRLQDALAHGCEYLTVDARKDTSMPILQKLGFIHIADATAYNWEPASP